MVKRIHLALVVRKPQVTSATGSQPQIVQQALQLGTDVGDLPGDSLLVIYQSALRRRRLLQSVYLSSQVPRHLHGSTVTVRQPVGGLDRRDEFLLSEARPVAFRGTHVSITVTWPLLLYLSSTGGDGSE